MTTLCDATKVWRGRVQCPRPAFYRVVYVEPVGAGLTSHDVGVCDSPAHLKHVIDRAHSTAGVHSVMVFPL